MVGWNFFLLLLNCSAWVARTQTMARESLDAGSRNLLFTLPAECGIIYVVISQRSARFGCFGASPLIMLRTMNHLEKNFYLTKKTRHAQQVLWHTLHSSVNTSELSRWNWRRAPMLSWKLQVTLQVETRHSLNKCLMKLNAQPECDICQRRGWRSRSRVWAFANLGIEIWVYRDYAKNITVYFIHRLRIMELMTCIILGQSIITFAVLH